MSSFKPGLKIFHKGLILVAVPLVIEIILIGSLSLLLLESDKERSRETRYRRCAALSAKIMSLSNDCVAAVFAYYQSGSKTFIKVFDASSDQIIQKRALLVKVAKGDALATEEAKKVNESQDDLGPPMDRLVEPARQGKRLLEVASTFEDVRKQFSDRRDRNMERMSSVTQLQEQIAADAGKRRLRLQSWQSLILSFGLAANILAGIVLMLFYRMSIVARLQVVMDNTRLLAERLPLKASLAGADEIARLDAAFHRMDVDLRAAAERERSLFENAGDVICVLDEQLQFLKLNPACKKLWGFDYGDLLERSVVEIIASPTGEDAENLFKKCLVSGKTTNLELNVYTLQSGISVNLWSIYYSGDERRLYCVAHDITERKKIELIKQSFVSMMSSDLHQPLLKIAGDVNKLLGDLKDEITARAVERMAMIKQNIARLLRLVNDLLEMEQIPDSVASVKSLCGVEELLLRAVQELQELSRKSKIGFELKCSADKWYADPNRILRVIVNLASNAIKFSPAGSTIILAATASTEFVEVQVIDRGRGVPENSRQSIFQKFKQLSAADGKRKTGTGLGLPICKDIIEEHSGEIGVSDHEGPGSTFWFRVPVSEDAFRRLASERAARYPDSVRSSASVGLSASAALASSAAASSMPGSEAIQAGPFPVPIRSGSRLNLMQKGLVLIGIPVIFELMFVGGIWHLLAQTEKSNAEELHLRQIASTAYKLLDSYYTASLLVVRYHSIENWHKYDSICSQIISTGVQLQKLVKGDSTARSYWLDVNKVHEKMLAAIARTRSMLKNDYGADLVEKAMPERYAMWAMSMGISRRLARLIDEAERKEFINPALQALLRRQQGTLLLLGLAGNVLLCLALVRFFSKDITSRLALQADNAGRIARDIPLNPPIPGTDEIARLDRAFHVTAEKLEEAIRKERAVFDNASDVIFVLDKNGVFLSCNPATESLFQYAKSDLCSSSLFDLIGEDDRESVRKLLNKDLSSAKKCEMQLIRRDESRRYVMMSFTRPRGEDRLYCVGHDISARKELEQIKQDVLAVVSHDLRTPLTSVNMAAALVEEGESGPVGPSALAIVRDIIMQGEQLIELINDLLDLEKLEAGQMQLLRAHLSSGLLLEYAIDNVQAQFPDLQIVQDDEEDSVGIDGDQDRIVQALTSILSYVAETNAPGSVIRIRSQANKSAFCWQIFDQSQALNEQQSNSLFDHLAAGKRQRPGSHLSILALPLARRIIEGHGGTISVLAAGDHGNVFSIELPC
jgi:PAS domain S-box-containing protein